MKVLLVASSGMLEEDVTDLRTPELEAGAVAWSDPTDTQPTLNEPYSDWATPQPPPPHPRPHPTPPPPPLPPESSPMLGFVVLAMAGFALGLGVVLSLIAVLLVL
jgi:hypothetical protein